MNVQDYFHPENIKLDITSPEAIYLGLIEMGKKKTCPVFIFDMSYDLRGAANYSQDQQLLNSQYVEFIAITTKTKIIKLEVDYLMIIVLNQTLEI